MLRHVGGTDLSVRVLFHTAARVPTNRDPFQNNFDHPSPSTMDLWPRAHGECSCEGQQACPESPSTKLPALRIYPVREK